ncbi:MAG: A24 family peptidase [Lachnospiraceae bacterium]|nr:A24 family peptidase [Lachnospiraceae bacterium]
MFAAMIVCLLVLTVTADLMTDRIPNALTLTGLVAGLWHAFERAGPSGLLSAAAAAAGMFGICFVLYLVRALRGGDGKLLAALSAMLGFSAGGRILLLGMMIALIRGVPLLFAGRKKEGTGIHFSVPVFLAALPVLLFAG